MSPASMESFESTITLTAVGYFTILDVQPTEPMTLSPFKPCAL